MNILELAPTWRKELHRFFESAGINSYSYKFPEERLDMYRKMLEKAHKEGNAFKCMDDIIGSYRRHKPKTDPPIAVKKEKNIIKPKVVIEKTIKQAATDYINKEKKIRQRDNKHEYIVRCIREEFKKTGIKFSFDQMKEKIDLWRDEIREKKIVENQIKLKKEQFEIFKQEFYKKTFPKIVLIDIHTKVLSYFNSVDDVCVHLNTYYQHIYKAHKFKNVINKKYLIKLID